MQSGKMTGVGPSAATTESYIISGKLQDSPGGRAECATQCPHMAVERTSVGRSPAGVNYWDARN